MILLVFQNPEYTNLIVFLNIKKRTHNKPKYQGSNTIHFFSNKKNPHLLKGNILFLLFFFHYSLPWLPFLLYMHGSIIFLQYLMIPYFIILDSKAHSELWHNPLRQICKNWEADNRGNTVPIMKKWRQANKIIIIKKNTSCYCSHSVFFLIICVYSQNKWLLLMRELLRTCG